MHVAVLLAKPSTLCYEALGHTPHPSNEVAGGARRGGDLNREIGHRGQDG